MNFGTGRTYATLGQIPEVARKAGLQALDEAADFMKMMAKNYVRVDTGTLRNSIRKHRTHNRVQVIAGGRSYVNPKTTKPCNYAALIEFKYPYMRPAYESVKPDLIRKIRENVIREVQDLEH